MMSGAPTPQEWTNMVAALQEATIAGSQMRDTTASDAMRDGATQRYVHAADAVIANLIVLRAAGVLGRFSAYLATRERA
jgi:hypothetical protein